MALEGNDRSFMPARIGVARIGATRIGYAPVDTDSDNLYIWTNTVGMTSQGPDTTWTEVTR